jgi:hypothetical protein
LESELPGLSTARSASASRLFGDLSADSVRPGPDLVPIPVVTGKVAVGHPSGDARLGARWIQIAAEDPGGALPMFSARRSTDAEVWWRCPAASPHGPLSNSQVGRFRQGLAMFAWRWTSPSETVRKTTLSPSRT